MKKKAKPVTDQEILDAGLDAMTESIVDLLRVCIRKRLSQYFEIVEERIKEVK